jgi:hypothetical protein
MGCAFCKCTHHLALMSMVASGFLKDVLLVFSQASVLSSMTVCVIQDSLFRMRSGAKNMCAMKFLPNSVCTVIVYIQVGKDLFLSFHGIS